VAVDPDCCCTTSASESYSQSSSADLVGNDVVEKPKEPGPMSDTEARKFGSRPMPFGQYNGSRIDEVLIDYPYLPRD